MKRFFYLTLLVMGLTACTDHSPQTGSSSLAEANRQIVQQYYNEVWNKGNLYMLDSLLAPAYINHTPSTPNPPAGPDGLKPIVQAIRRAFPDLHYEIQEIIATDSFAVARVIMTGTQQDSLFGLPPTGKRVNVLQINEEKIINGKIVEHWRVTDELSLMKQLGVVQ